MRCSDDDLAALASGSLAASDAARVIAHVDGCVSCRLALGSAAGGPAPLGPGAHVGRYVLERQLGVGASGRVWVAHDPALDRRVAIKVLHDDTEGAEERLRREGRAVARLRHPGVVGVHEVGHELGRAFLVMELVDGAPIDVWCRQHRPNADQQRALARATASAVAAVHGAGLVHGDIKPANLLVTATGEPRLVDLGLARGVPQVEAPLDGARTVAGPADTPGTPAYMAPELLAGAMPTEASDQFALAVSLLEAFSGARPFGDARTIDALREAQRTPPPSPPPQIEASLGRVLLQGLATRAEHRHASVTALASALGAPTRRRRRGWALGVSVALLFACAAAWHATREPGSALRLPRTFGVAPAQLAALAAPDDTDRAAALALGTRLARQDAALAVAYARLSHEGADDATRVCVHLRDHELASLARTLTLAPATPPVALGKSLVLTPVSGCWPRAPRPIVLADALPLAEELAALRVAAFDGDPEIAARAARLHARALRAGADELAAEASRLEAQATSQMADGVRLFRRALVEAERAGASLSRAAVLLSWCSADLQRSSLDELRARLDHAQAVIDDLVDAGDLPEHLLALRCTLAQAHKQDDARALCTASLALALATLGEAKLLVAQRQIALALALPPDERDALLADAEAAVTRWAGHGARIELSKRRAATAALRGDAAGRRHHLEAAAAVIAQHGASVLITVPLNTELAAIELEAGMPVLALARLTWSVPIAELALGADTAASHNAHFMRGRALVALGAVEAGLREQQAAYEGLARVLGESSHGADDLGVVLVWALLDAGRLVEAHATAERLWRRAQHAPAGSLARLEAQGVLALARVAVGEDALARAPAEAYVAESRARHDPPSVRVEVALALASIDWREAATRRAEVVADVRALRGELVAEGEGAAGSVALVDRWLARHRASRPR